MALSRDELIEHVLEVIRSECQNQAVEINMDTAVESVNLDSIDVINILFLLEDEYKINIDLNIQAKPATIGELVNTLVEFIPHTEAVK